MGEGSRPVLGCEPQESPQDQPPNPGQGIAFGLGQGIELGQGCGRLDGGKEAVVQPLPAVRQPGPVFLRHGPQPGQHPPEPEVQRGGILSQDGLLWGGEVWGEGGRVPSQDPLPQVAGRGMGGGGGRPLIVPRPLARDGVRAQRAF